MATRQPIWKVKIPKGQARFMRWLGALCGIMAYLTCIAVWAEWDAFGEFSGNMFLVFLFAAYMSAIWFFMQGIRREFFWPAEWKDALERYPSPRHVKGSTLQFNSIHLRFGKRGRLVPVAGICAEDGILVEDAMPIGLGKIFVPWHAISNVAVIELPWYALWRREAVEVAIDRLAFTLIVNKATWDRKIAARIGKAES